MASARSRPSSGGRIREGLAWCDAALTDQNARLSEVAPAVRARALADTATLNAHMGATDSMEQALQALAIAREVDDPALLARALTACSSIAVYDPEMARPYFAEAIDLARSLGDGWRLGQILSWQAFGSVMVGDPTAIRAAAVAAAMTPAATPVRYRSSRGSTRMRRAGCRSRFRPARDAAHGRC